MADYDILGNIVVIKGEGKSKKQKLEQAKQLLKKPSVKTVLELVGNVKGRLRTIKTKYLLGEKNLIAEVLENGCKFKFNIETCYFTPRLSNERKENARSIKKKDRVLVMFAGVGVFPITIYKFSKPEKIVGIEIGKECCKYFKENLKLNKVPAGKIEVVQGDVKKKISGKEKYDIIIMARPNLKESFLKYGFRVSKKGTRIFYHGFCHENDLKGLLESLKKEAAGLKKKIRIGKVVKIGNIAPFKFRYRIEMKVL
jgi:tRNA (guanine37-N1)-methyltransferase